MSPEAPESLVQALAQILHSYGDTVLDGSHVLTLLTPCLQVVTRLFEQLFPRGPGSGFQALPAHPADSFPILRAQFLLDMLQKTPSLKLIHPSECPRQFDVNIFPFKSLRHLEMCHLPPHCLRGLCSVYSQMEVLTCTRCVSSLEEVISGCGGDLNSALPWLELHTLDFSYNMIKNLDSSLELLNSLKILNLSHNQIAECGSYLKVLSELQYLNLGYNCLSVVPELSVGSTAKLHSLILRYNQLSSTSGIENLHNLQHLDLSYNLLLEHTELSGLSGLHNLKKLYLAGNPLFFHRDYRTVTAQHLSLKASDKVLLDGKFLSISEIMKAQARGEVRVQPSSSVTESSCTGDLTDSCSAAEISAPRIPRKKSKVRVRTASISERSDSEYEQRGPAIEPVLQHQKDIERTDSFREQFGVNWLQYRPHLESELDPDYLTRQSPTPPRQSPSPAVPNTDAERNSPSPVLDCTNQDPDMLISTEKKLIDRTEESLQEQVWELQGTTEPVDEEVLIGDALCSPVVVCPVLNGQPRNPDWPWVFLRIIPHYLLEIDPENGRILLKRELGSLRGIQTSHTQWDCHGKVQDLPLLTLSFESVCEERQTVNYVVLDNSPEISSTTLLDLLRPVLEENQREKSEAQEDLLRLQCLKCKTEFSQQEDTGELPSMQCTREEERNETARTVEAEGGRALHRHHTGEASCPSCGSLHIILAPAIPRGEGSSPLHPAPVTQSEDGGEQGSKSFYLSDDESDPMTAPCDEESTVTFYSFDNEDQGSQAAPDSNGSSKDSSSHYSQLLSPSVGSTQALDFHFVDHRLKLYLDMEILVGESEEFLCYIKAPLVHFGKTSEFWSLVVVSNEKIYFLEITGETRGDTCDWLRPGDSQDLSLLTHLHFGTQEQSLSLGFEDCGAAYTLLIRNRHHCKAFAKHLLDKVSELPARYRSNIQHSSEENLTAQHRLWPLVHDKHGISESSRPPDCLYVLLFFQREDVVSTKTDQSYPTTNVHLPPPNTASPAALEQGASSASPRSLLLTQTHMYLLVEDHQWMYGAPSRDCRVDSRATVEVKEKQPISNISSVHLFQCAALHLRIHLYNETQQSESAWLLWTEDPEMPRQIVDWLRTPWEAEYHIHLNPVIHRTL